MFKLSLTSALVAGVLLTGVASAQDLIPFGAPLKYARYDMATGATQIFDHDPGQAHASPGDTTPVIIYDNSTTGGSFSTGSANAVKTNHHMGWGVANYGGSGATVTEFRIAYATNVTVAQGVVTFRIRLYDGATGTGNKGTVNPNGDLLIPGLPNSASGGIEGWIVDVTPVTPIVMADGPFGWSYNSDNFGTSSGPIICIAPVGPGVTGFYDRYNEITEAYVGTFNFAAPNIGGFCMRFTGRTNAPPPVSPWVLYGTKSGVDLSAEGSATPGSVDNVLHIQSTINKKAILVAGVVQSNVTSVPLGLTFYALPWLIQINDLPLSSLSGSLDLPVALPNTLPPGTVIYMQVFSQKLNNAYTKYSEGLQLTVQ